MNAIYLSLSLCFQACGNRRPFASQMYKHDIALNTTALVKNQVKFRILSLNIMEPERSDRTNAIRYQPLSKSI